MSSGKTTDEKKIVTAKNARRSVAFILLERYCHGSALTFHLKSGSERKLSLFNPPFRTNKLLVHHKDFIVMILRGPNTRLDFHIDPGDEFFYQVEGEMELVLKPEGERRQSHRSKKGRSLSVRVAYRIRRGALKIPGVWLSSANGATKSRKSSFGFAKIVTRRCCRAWSIKEIFRRKYRPSTPNSTPTQSSALAAPAVMFFPKHRWRSG